MTQGEGKHFEYCNIMNSIAIDKFPQKITKGVIISIFKSGDKNELGN